MASFRNLAPALLAVSMGILPGEAIASTTAYVTGGLLKETMEECFKSIKSAADKSGFTEYQETLLDEDKKAGDFHADQKNSPLHLTARCDPQEGVWSAAVSGIDEDQTLEGYNSFFKGFE
jgi:hypothetical protein